MCDFTDNYYFGNFVDSLLPYLCLGKLAASVFSKPESWKAYLSIALGERLSA
jgi:hypothetical protein